MALLTPHPAALILASWEALAAAHLPFLERSECVCLCHTVLLHSAACLLPGLWQGQPFQSPGSSPEASGFLILRSQRGKV